MTRFFPEGSRVRSAASTAALLALCLALAGCSAGHNSRPDPSPFNTPPLNAYALSGGKIKQFTPMPGTYDDPADKAFLLACQQLPVTSTSARSAFVVVTTGQFGKFPLHALEVGQKMLVLPGDLVTMGLPGGSDSSARHNFMLYPVSPESITFIHGSRTALVGGVKVKLHDPIIATESHDLVITVSDMEAVLHERDVQRHQPPFIRNVQVIYDIRDYHK